MKFVVGGKILEREKERECVREKEREEERHRKRESINLGRIMEL
jgi:hypothetical protein